MSQHIAFAMLDEQPDNGWDVYLMDTRDGSARPLTTRMNAAYFAWSPDGQRLAYVSAPKARPANSAIGHWLHQLLEGDPSRLYIMNADGAEPRLCFQDDHWLQRLTWLPDGERLSIRAYQRGEAGLYTLRPDGSDLRLITSAQMREPTWSPDGTSILFGTYEDRGTSVWVMNAAGSGARCLARHPEGVDDFAWAPDGQQIAFISFHHDAMRQCLYVMDADGSNVRQVAWMSYEGGFAWSPDGQQLAFIGELPAEPSIPAEQLELHGDLGLIVVDAAGTSLRSLVTDIQSDAEYLPADPAWSPDGKQLAFLSGVEEREEHLHIINADGTGRRCLTEGTPFTRSKLGLSWQP